MAQGKLIHMPGQKREAAPPIIICSHCKNEIQIDITNWKDDVTKVMQDKCPKCHGTLFVCMFLLAHKDLKMLMQCVQAVTEALSGANQFLR